MIFRRRGHGRGGGRVRVGKTELKMTGLAAGRAVGRTVGRTLDFKAASIYIEKLDRLALKHIFTPTQQYKQ